MDSKCILQKILYKYESTEKYYRKYNKSSRKAKLEINEFFNDLHLLSHVLDSKLTNLYNKCIYCTYLCIYE